MSPDEELALYTNALIGDVFDEPIAEDDGIGEYALVRKLGAVIRIPNIRELIHEHIVDEHARKREEHTPSGYTWTANRLGSCLRSQYMERVLKKPTLWPITAQAIMRFAVGDFWNEWYADRFTKMGWEFRREVFFHIDELDICGYADFMVDEPFQLGVEVKSVQSDYFWYRLKNEELTATPENMMQGAIYDVACKAQGDERPWILLPTSKDDLWIDDPNVVTKDHQALALARLDALNLAKDTSIAPPCTCLDDWQWRYCNFYEGSETSKKEKVSEKVEGEFYKNGKPKYRNSYKPDGECCVV